LCTLARKGASFLRPLMTATTRIVSASLLGTCLVACAPVVSSNAAPPASARPPAVAPRDPEPGYVSEPVPTDTFVLVWNDAPLHPQPSSKESVRLYDFGARPRAQRPGEGFVGRLLERRGPWRRIASVDRWLDDDGHPIHCIGTDFVRSPGFELQVWVHEDSLMPLVTETISHHENDGTSVVLEPGAPMANGQPWADGYTFPIDVATEQRGFEYHPQRSPERVAARERGADYVEVETLDARLGTRAVPWVRPPLDYGDAIVVPTRSDGDQVRLLLSRCGAAELSLESKVVDDKPMAGIFGMLGGTAEARPAGAVEAGTTLYWPGGAPAGVVLQDLVRADLAPGREALTCMQLHLGTESRAEGFRDATATVCVETAQIHPTTTRGPDL